MKIFDLHCDTIGECYNRKENLYKNSLHLSLERAMMYDEYNQVFAIWIPDELRGISAVEYFDNVADLFYESVELSKDVVSLYESEAKTPIKAVLSVEGASACGGTIDGLYHLFDRGVRLITLTWNGNNEIASGAFSEGGITTFGKAFIKETQRLGIVLDVSHLNTTGFKELLELYDGPFVASHSNADIVDNFYGHKRNLQDWQIDAIRDRGGLIGLNFCSDFMDLPDKTGVRSMAEHIKYFLSRGCEDIIALGSDFDGCDMHSDFSGVEKLRSVYFKLIDEGIAESLVEKVFYLNAKNFFDKNIDKI